LRTSVSKQKKRKKCSRYTSHYGMSLGRPQTDPGCPSAPVQRAMTACRGAAAMVRVASNAQFKNASCEREAASMKANDFSPLSAPRRSL
jgi:hypothetical protein